MPSRRLIRFARENRREMTPSESILWEELRGRRLGVRFRRQDPIGPFIADFSCRAARLVIEVKGVSHDDSDRDRRRDGWFNENGWFVLRLHDYVVTQIDDAVAMIEQAMADPSRYRIPSDSTRDRGLQSEDTRTVGRAVPDCGDVTTHL